jgi:hypothetical protein
MDSNIFLDARYAVICSMLFTTIIAATAETPAAIPEVFQRMWHRYQLFQKAIKSRALGPCENKFWEIDMTKFEP